MKCIGTGILALLLAAMASAADDPEPRVSDLAVGFDGPRVLVTCQLRDALDTRARERIASGLPTSFVFELQLLRNRRWWFWDHKVARATVEMVAQYNAVTLEYLVHQKLNDKLVSSRVVQDLAELEPAMTTLRQVPAFLLPEPPDGRLTVRVRAELGSRTMLSLIPIHVNTDWAESADFEVAPEDLAAGPDAAP